MHKINATSIPTSMCYKIINTLRILSVDMVDKANSGHPGMPLGCAPAMFVLWCKIMNYNPENPLWEYRDRFILSNGHGCALLYSMLFLLGYDYTLDDLKNFRQIHSKTPGHPEYDKKLGIEISTGPLGQGIANGVGMAISSKKKGIDNNIYVMCGDGCLMEGVSYEAASLAGHLGLNNLVVLYDDNGITIDGKTDITFTEDTRSRFIALKWNVLEVVNGDTDINDIYEKLMTAKQSRDKPTIIFIKTTIGYGSIAAGKSSVHGAPLGQTNTQNLKEYFGFDKTKSFFVDEDVQSYFDEFKKQKVLSYNEFNANNTTTASTTTSKNDISNTINEIDKIKNQEKDYATRESSNIVLKKIAELLPDIIVGSADLAESNKTMVTNTHINKNDFSPKYLHYGIREHAMCSIANGISSCDIIPVVSTFLVFITYCLAPIRMAALSKHQVIYVLTHDSVFLGEDGPTHQPVESLTILRSIPNLLTIRPCDVTEVSGAYQIALDYNGPTAIILSRQTLPNLQNSCSLKMKKGAYIAYEPRYANDNTNQDLNLIIVATGSEVHLAIEIAKKLDINCRVVSMPCCELFDKQDYFYKEEILPKNVKKMSLEAGLTSGWYKYVDFTYGIDQFGESAKIVDIKNHFGFTLDKIVEFIKYNIQKI
jgi:transketolase